MINYTVWHNNSVVKSGVTDDRELTLRENGFNPRFQAVFHCENANQNEFVLGNLDNMDIVRVVFDAD